MVIFNISPDSREKALILSQSTGLPIVEEVPDGFYLTYEKEVLYVKNEEQGSHFKLNVDLKKDWSRLQSQKISLKKDLLCRAVGFSGQEKYVVFDGTVGFAKDSLHLIFLGCQIIGAEKNPIVFALLENALSLERKISEKIKLKSGDSYQHIQDSFAEVDCLYLDPMFEDIKKKSAPKKEMAFLRSLHSSSQDVQRVMEKALELGVKRMVVKRPLRGENLLRKPNFTYEGKLIRFDVYIK